MVTSPLAGPPHVDTDLPTGPTMATAGTESASARPVLWQRLRTDIAGMTPAYFGLVMATGIVSIAAQLEGWLLLAHALFVLNNVMYAALWLLTIARVVWFAPRVWLDLQDHLRGPGFFTLVAGTGVLGAQFVLQAASYRIAGGLWALSLLLWLALTYTIFTAFVVKHDKPALDKGINGGWLLAVVATQSVAVLSTLLAAKAPEHTRLALDLLALSMWLWGGVLYVWTMTLIFYRYTFFRMAPADLSPPDWINMGAMAISTLAGSLLIIHSPGSPFLMSVLPFLKGFTLMYWATGTWWIPVLLILGVWRHVYRRFPLRYGPLYWGLVFPLGMYAACTDRLGHAMGFGLLDELPRLFLLAALVAWSLAFIGLLRDLMRRLGLLQPRTRSDGPEP